MARRLLLLPALLPTVAVLGGGLGAVALQAFGLMPLVGEPELTVDAFTGQGGDLARSALVSFGIATAATLIAAAVGLATALAITARPGALSALATLTIPLPHLVGAAAMGLLLADSGLLARLFGAQEWPQLVGGPWWVAVVAEFAWKESAFVALVVAGTMAARAEDYTATAAVLGAGPSTRVRLVLIPLAAPALAATSLISFAYAFGSYEVAKLLGRPYPEPLSVLAVRLFNGVDLQARSAAAAAALVTATLCLLCVGAAVHLMRRAALWR